MNFFYPRKTKTKIDKNLNFAGVVDYLAINILLKFKSHILISSEVIRGKKIVTWILWQNVTLRYKTKTKKDKNLDFAGFVEYVTSNILFKFKSPIFISSEVKGGKKIVTWIFLPPLKRKLKKIKSWFLQDLLIIWQ